MLRETASLEDAGAGGTLITLAMTNTVRALGPDPGSLYAKSNILISVGRGPLRLWAEAARAITDRLNALRVTSGQVLHRLSTTHSVDAGHRRCALPLWR